MPLIVLFGQELRSQLSQNTPIYVNRCGKSSYNIQEPGFETRIDTGLQNPTNGAPNPREIS